MPLEELKEKIYNPDEETEKRAHEASPFDPSISLKAQTAEFQKEKEWEAPQKGLTLEQKKIIKIGAWILGGILLVIAIAFAAVKIRQSAFNEARVSLAIIGLESSGSNDLVEYRLAYKNENRATLKNAQILLNYSDNFRPDENGELKIDNASNSRLILGDIAPNSQGEKVIAGKFFAPANAVVYINADLEFTPSGFSSVFRSSAKIGVNIRTSPLKLEIESPLEIISGKKIDYVINFSNASINRYANVKIKMEYPKEFNFTSANPPAALNNELWNIGDLEPGAGGKIVISGNISGARGDSKIIKATIAADDARGGSVTFEDQEKTTKIVASPLFISQQANGKENLNVNAGQSVFYTINFGNVGEVGLRNSVITMAFNSPVVDYASLRAAGGFFNENSKTVIWKASEIPELASLEPGAKKSFRFEVKTLKNLPVAKKEDKNFVLETVVSIDSPDIPTPISENKIISSNRLELKVNSPVSLDVTGFHFDKNMENFGPVPPFLGQETSYSIHWKITNASNDLSDVQVNSSLPSGVKWTGKVYPESEADNLKYNDRTNQVTWNIGPMENGVGFVSKEREAVFQVSIAPQVNQVGSKVKLLNASVLTGKDLFTGEDVNIQTKEKSTDLYEDAELGFRYAVVDK